MRPCTGSGLCILFALALLGNCSDIVLSLKKDKSDRISDAVVKIGNSGISSVGAQIALQNKHIDEIDPAEISSCFRDPDARNAFEGNLKVILKELKQAAHRGREYESFAGSVMEEENVQKSPFRNDARKEKAAETASKASKRGGMSSAMAEKLKMFKEPIKQYGYDKTLPKKTDVADVETGETELFKSPFMKTSRKKTKKSGEQAIPVDVPTKSKHRSFNFTSIYQDNNTVKEAKDMPIQENKGSERKSNPILEESSLQASVEDYKHVPMADRIARLDKISPFAAGLKNKNHERFKLPSKRTKQRTSKRMREFPKTTASNSASRRDARKSPHMAKRIAEFEKISPFKPYKYDGTLKNKTAEATNNEAEQSPPPRKQRGRRRAKMPTVESSSSESHNASDDRYVDSGESKFDHNNIFQNPRRIKKKKNKAVEQPMVDSVGEGRKGPNKVADLARMFDRIPPIEAYKYDGTLKKARELNPIAVEYDPGDKEINTMESQLELSSYGSDNSLGQSSGEQSFDPSSSQPKTHPSTPDYHDNDETDQTERSENIVERLSALLSHYEKKIKEQKRTNKDWNFTY